MMSTFSPNFDLFSLLNGIEDDDSMAPMDGLSQGDTAASLIDDFGLFENISRCSSLNLTMSGGGNCQLPPKKFSPTENICGDLTESLGRCNSLSSLRRTTSLGLTPPPSLQQQELASEHDKISFVNDLQFEIQAAKLTMNLGSSSLKPPKLLLPPPPPAPTSTRQQQLKPVVLSVPRAKEDLCAPPLSADEVSFVTCVGPDGGILTRVWDGLAQPGDSPVVVISSSSASAPTAQEAFNGRRSGSKTTGRAAVSAAADRGRIKKATSTKGRAATASGEELVAENGDLWSAIQLGLETRFFVSPPPPDHETAHKREVWRTNRSRARQRLDAKRQRQKLAGGLKRHYPERQAAATTRKRVGGRFQKEHKTCFKSVSEIQQGAAAAAAPRV
jgi:hypothetical protein